MGALEVTEYEDVDFTNLPGGDWSFIGRCIVHECVDPHLIDIEEEDERGYVVTHVGTGAIIARGATADDARTAAKYTLLDAGIERARRTIERVAKEVEAASA